MIYASAQGKLPWDKGLSHALYEEMRLDSLESTVCPDKYQQKTYKL